MEWNILPNEKIEGPKMEPCGTTQGSGADDVGNLSTESLAI